LDEALPTNCRKQWMNSGGDVCWPALESGGRGRQNSALQRRSRPARFDRQRKQHAGSAKCPIGNQTKPFVLCGGGGAWVASLDIIDRPRLDHEGVPAERTNRARQMRGRGDEQPVFLRFGLEHGGEEYGILVRVARVTFNAHSPWLYALAKQPKNLGFLTASLIRNPEMGVLAGKPVSLVDAMLNTAEGDDTSDGLGVANGARGKTFSRAATRTLLREPGAVAHQMPIASMAATLAVVPAAQTELAAAIRGDVG
jgi:hypothetical protein